jgi:hypothetical protein
MDGDPDERGIGQEPPAAEEQGLSDDDPEHRDVHRVPDVAIESRHHEPLRWHHRRRRPPAVYGEARERFREPDEADEREGGPDGP